MRNIVFLMTLAFTLTLVDSSLTSMANATKTNTIPRTTLTTTPFPNLKNGQWVLYNQSSGSSSVMHFNHDGTYDRILHGNDLQGLWTSSIVTQEVLQMCPTEPNVSQCMLISMEMDTPNSVGFLDQHSNIIHLFQTPRDHINDNGYTGEIGR